MPSCFECKYAHRCAADPDAGILWDWCECDNPKVGWGKLETMIEDFDLTEDERPEFCGGFEYA